MHPDANTLIAMRVQDISPEYVRDCATRASIPIRTNSSRLKVQGADGAYYRAMKEAGMQPDVNTLIGMKVQDVTPEYVREIRAAGLAVTRKSGDRAEGAGCYARVPEGDARSGD